MSAHRWCSTAQSTANLQHFEAVVGSTKLEEDERRGKKLIQQTAPTNLQFSPKSSRNIRKHRKSITKPSHQRNWFSLTVEITWHLSFRDEKYVKKKKKRTSRLKSLTKPICDIKNWSTPHVLELHAIYHSHYFNTWKIINIYMTGRRIYLRARANKVNNNNKISKFKKWKRIIHHHLSTSIPGRIMLLLNCLTWDFTVLLVLYRFCPQWPDFRKLLLKKFWTQV